MEANQIFASLIIALTLILVLITTNFVRRGRLNVILRRIPAYERIPSLVGLSIESSRPLHISLGSAGIGDESTILAITSAELAYQVTNRAAIGDAPPILTLSNTSAIPLGQDTLRRAYNQRGLSERYSTTNVRWYPNGPRSLVFAAAVSTMIKDDKVAASIMGGSYGAELALITDASKRSDIPIVAYSNQLEGQAVAYALADEALIGEEIFAVGTYLEGGSVQVSESIVIDVLRWLLIIVMIIGFVAGFLNGR